MISYDGWLTESYIYKFISYISILLSQASLLYILSVLAHHSAGVHVMSAPYLCQHMSLNLGAEDHCDAKEHYMGLWVA